MLAVCGPLVLGSADVERGPCSASLADEAKRWFECSTILCRFVPDGRLRAEKVCPMTTTKRAHNAASARLSLDIESLHRATDALHRSTHLTILCLTCCMSLMSVVLLSCCNTILASSLLPIVSELVQQHTSTIVSYDDVFAPGRKIHRSDVAQRGTCRRPISKRSEGWEVDLSMPEVSVCQKINQRANVTYQTHLILFDVARHGEQLRVMVIA